MGPLINCAGRATVLGAEGEQAVGIVPSRTCDPSQAVLWRKLINVKVGVEVNAAQAYIAYLQLSIVPRRDFRCQVPLPAVGKVRVELYALGPRTSRDKVERIRRVKGWAIERALSPGADREWRIRAYQPGARAADRIASEELPNSRAQDPISMAEYVPRETNARRNQVVVGGNNAAILGIDASSDAQRRTTVGRSCGQHNAVARGSGNAEVGIVGGWHKGRQLVVGQPCGRHKRPADAVIQSQRPGCLPRIPKVELDIAPARIADRIPIVLVH